MTEVRFTSDITVEPIAVSGDDDSILRAMLVSTSKDDAVDTMEESAKRGRINFLMANRHGTPFEHAQLRFYVRAPIMVYREFHRHRIGWSYNEESGRYTQLQPEFYICPPDRNLVQQGKPGAYEFVPGDEQQYHDYLYYTEESCAVAYRNYEHLLDKGIAKEVARQVLPVNIMSSQYATCNPRSLMAFLSLRTNRPDSAYPSKPMREIEVVAEQMEAIFAEHFPITHETFEANGRVSP